MKRSRILIALMLLFVTACTEKPQSTHPAQTTYKPDRIADGVYVIHGPTDLPNKENKGFMNNPGIVITNRGAVVIDPGGSRGTGDMVVNVTKTLTDKPIIAVFNTHIHGDHWLGNEGIKSAYPKAVIYAHPRMKELAVAGDGENWVKLIKQMTEGTMVETKAVVPDLGVDNEEIIKLGDLQFRIHHFGKSHTDNDIMIEVVERKVLFLGDNALIGRIGRMDDGNFKGNIRTLEEAQKIGVTHFVPGHGPSGDATVAKTYHTYLSTLHGNVETLYKKGVTDFEMKPTVTEALVAFRTWKGFAEELGKHISLAYLQIEAESF